MQHGRREEEKELEGERRCVMLSRGGRSLRLDRLEGVVLGDGI